MKYLVIAVKGVAYGITHVAPGLGGGLVLLMMGIYRQFVEAISNLTHRRKWMESLRFLVPLGLGMVVGVVLSAVVLHEIWRLYPAATMFFFMGLLVGTIPSILRMHQDMRPSLGRGIALLLGLLLVVALKALPANRTSMSTATLSHASGIAYNTLISFFAGGASVTPGLDGSYVMLLGGTYAVVLEAVAALRYLTVHWGALLSTGAGALLGIVAFAKLIDMLMKRYRAASCFCILGLVVGSIYGLWPQEAAGSNVVLLALAFGVGVTLALLLNRSQDTR